MSARSVEIWQMGGRCSVKLHGSEVLRFEKTEVTVASHGGGVHAVVSMCGWDTVTTRRTINRAAKMFNLGISVFRRGGHTYLRTPDGIQPMSASDVFLINLGADCTQREAS